MLFDTVQDITSIIQGVISHLELDLKPEYAVMHFLIMRSRYPRWEIIAYAAMLSKGTGHVTAFVSQSVHLSTGYFSYEYTHLN